MSTDTEHKKACSHCGDQCDTEEFTLGEELFCCNGCKMVFSLLSEHGMDQYYSLDSQPGISQRQYQDISYDFLDDEATVAKLLDFNEGNKARFRVHLPQIHCSSCLWLLEHLYRLKDGVLSSTVNFAKKEAYILFDTDRVQLRDIVELLAAIGYPPNLNYNLLKHTDSKTGMQDRSLLYKLGLAGFCFGNVMLLSFPEYLGLGNSKEVVFIGYLNILLALPILLYAGRDYLVSAWKALRFRSVNIDLPIAIGMLTLFVRSVYEIVSATGAGYLDSFTGFVFFLLIGRWFQSYTFRSLDFNRDYSSYFPLSVQKKMEHGWQSITLDQVEVGDILMVKNEQLVPADAVLRAGKARIDYSFVTGEADAIVKEEGDKILAGGKQQGSAIEIELVSGVDNSYLTQLWNDQVFKQQDTGSTTFMNVLSKYFVVIILAIALMTFIYWQLVDSSVAFNATTAVLIIACPCVLALSIPFTYGNIIRLLGSHGAYLKSSDTVELLQNIDVVVLDKTGTLTNNQAMKVRYDGSELTDAESSMIRTACSHSGHPLSVAVVRFLGEYPITELDRYEDQVGKGHLSYFGDSLVKIGSAEFLFGEERPELGSVCIEIDGVFKGSFQYTHSFRTGIPAMIDRLKSNYELHVLTGDNDRERALMETVFEPSQVKYNQTPFDKLEFVSKLQQQGKRVLMIGDGLNDAGALAQSDVGLVVTENNLYFTPASQWILEAKKLKYFARFMQFFGQLKWIIFGAICFAILYNGIGLYYAVQGLLSPVVAAILMPISSITIILYGVLSSYFLFKYRMEKQIDTKT